MKVLFSNPPWWVRPDNSCADAKWLGGVRAGSRWPATYPTECAPDRFRFGGYLPYPFFMGYATTYVRQKTGQSVAFRDSIALRESNDRYFQYLEHEQFDFIFIESATPSWEHDQSVLREIHRRCPNSKMVITGPVAATRAEEILADHPVYACIKGEYEKGSVKVIEGASGVIEMDLMTTEEMNAAPFPYYDELHARRYWDGSPAGQIRPHAQIWSSRGCPFKCIFCVWPATMTGHDPDGAGTRTVRYYSPEYLDGFVRHLVEDYHIRSVYFDDDTFNLGNKHVLGVCEVMARIGVPWSAMCRADTISLDTWQVMKESGCFGVKIGFESGSQWVVDNIIKKNLNLEKAREVVHLLFQLGMTIHGTFTLGLPGESPDQMQETIKFFKSLPLTTAQISGTAAIEGTPLHTLEQKGRLEKYPGAIAANGYVSESNGNLKLNNLLGICS